MKNFIKSIIIFSGILYTAADLKCELKKDVDRAYNKLSDIAIKGLNLAYGKSTEGSLQVFQCRCEDDDVSVS